MAICSKCGAEVPEGAQFCPACGTPVNGGAQDPEENAETAQAQGENGGSAAQAGEAESQTQEETAASAAQAQGAAAPSSAPAPASGAGQPQAGQGTKDTQPQASSGSAPGHGGAVASLVCGIVGVVMWCTGIGAIVSIILGIVGLVLANKSKQAGNTEGIRTAGFVLSIIGLVGGCIVFIWAVVAMVFIGAVANGIAGAVS